MSPHSSIYVTRAGDGRVCSKKVLEGGNCCDGFGRHEMGNKFGGCWCLLKLQAWQLDCAQNFGGLDLSQGCDTIRDADHARTKGWKRPRNDPAMQVVAGKRATPKEICNTSLLVEGKGVVKSLMMVPGRKLRYLIVEALFGRERSCPVPSGALEIPPFATRDQVFHSMKPLFLRPTLSLDESTYSVPSR